MTTPNLRRRTLGSTRNEVATCDRISEWKGCRRPEWQVIATDGNAVRIGEDAGDADGKKVSKMKELGERKITGTWKRRCLPEWKKVARMNNALDSKSKMKQ